MLICDFCKSEKEKMTIQEHPSGKVLTLCFMGCQHFPEPYEATGLSHDWKRVDPWIKKRGQPKLRKTRGK